MRVTATLLAAKAALGSSTLYAKWKRDNPREYARIEAYWADGGAFPQTVTAFGLHYALDARAYHELLPRVVFAPAATATASPPVPDGADIRVSPAASVARASVGSVLVKNPDPYLPFIPA